MENINKERLDNIVELIFTVARGDYSVQIPMSENNDELDSLAMGFNMMIDELKLSISQIEKQRDYTNKIINYMSDSLFVLNSDNTIRTINRAAANLLGIKESELLGSRFEDLIVETDKTLVELGITKDFFVDIETTIITKNLTKIPVVLSCSNIKKDEGLDSIVCIVHDITKIKSAEQELIKAKEHAEEINKLKSSFLSTMGHELRTPLFGILGFSEILQKEMGHGEYKEMVDAIYSNGKRLLDTLNAILKYSRIESEKVEDYLVPISPAQVIRKHIAIFKEMSLKKNIQFSADLCDDDFLCLLDEGLFTQVIYNLVENAVKFTKIGRVKINLDIIRDKNIAQIKITDTGIGIKKEHQNMIYEDFRQASEGLTRSYEGAGLGLTLTKRYVEIMKGRIFVESEYGKGSKFTVMFPVMQQSEN